MPVNPELSTKARTLAAVTGRLKVARVLPLTFFTLNELLDKLDLRE